MVSGGTGGAECSGPTVVSLHNTASNSSGTLAEDVIDVSDGEGEVNWAEEQENEEEDDDEVRSLDAPSSDDEDNDIEVSDTVSGLTRAQSSARTGMFRMATSLVLDADEEGDRVQGEADAGIVNDLVPPESQDRAGVTAEVDEEAAEDAEEVMLPNALPEPREDGFMGCGAADSSGVTIRRELSWMRAKGGAKKQQDAQRSGNQNRGGGGAGGAGVGAGGGGAAGVKSTGTRGVERSGSGLSEGYEVRWLLNNEKYLPIHVKIQVLGPEGVTGHVGETRTCVPQQSADIVVARVVLRDKSLLSEVCIRWWFGLGNPDAVHNNNIRYSLPFSGKQRHVCQSFGGRFSHTGRLHYSVDVDLPPGHQVRACRSGVVQALCNSHGKGGPSRKFAGMANYVHILHSDGTVGCYMHFEHNGVTCRLGSAVKRGQVIGFIGLTGFTSRPHVHFHVKRHGDFFRGTEWETVPFVFKAQASKGLVLKKGCWYENRAGVAVMTRSAPSKQKKSASSPQKTQTGGGGGVPAAMYSA